MAPGESIRVARADSSSQAYGTESGTSLAAPFVSGLVAAMLEANPNLSPDQVCDILTSTADRLPGRWGVQSQGAGMIDPGGALDRAESLFNLHP